MKVSAKAQYACVAMLELALGYQDSSPMQIKMIADAHGISQRFLVQILLQLKVAGLVVSVRGASGGYHLAKSPDRVTLGEIIHAIDQPASVSSALDELTRSLSVDAVASALREVQTQAERLLEEITLEDLIRRASQKNVLSYQI
jgi:Rrf2 family transcriptional regulator, cysteine metabolism repressor